MDINKQIIDSRIVKIVSDRPEWFEPDTIETDANRDNIRRRRLSKAFVILVVSAYLGIDLSEAESLLTEGGGDAGVDAIDIGDVIDDEFTVTIFQGKYVFDLEKESNFPANSVQKLVSAIGSIFDPNKNIEMNEDLKPKVEEIRSLISDGKIPSVKCVFANNGLRWNQEGENHINNSPYPKSIVQFEYFNHNDIIDFIKSKKPIEATLKLSGAAIQEDFNFKRVIVGKLNVREVATLFDTYQDDLLEMNVRKHLGLGKSRVNLGIQQTLLGNKKDNFYFYNNGITMICSQFLHNALQSTDWQVRVKGIQIINGGQSCKTIQHVISENPTIDYSQVYVLVRLYELPEGNDDLITAVTIATNSQNPVDLSDLRANDEIQKKLELDIAGLGYTYKRKKDLNLSTPEVILSSVAAESIYSIWRDKPYLAKYKKAELFGKFYDEIFNNVNGAELVLAVLIYRYCDNQRRKLSVIEQYPHAPYSNYFMAMLIAQLVLKDSGINYEQLTHQNFASIKSYFENNKERLFDRANGILIEALNKLYPEGYKSIPASRLSATFRRGDLMDYLNNLTA
jgi:hypothetical protein